MTCLRTAVRFGLPSLLLLACGGGTRLRLPSPDAGLDLARTADVVERGDAPSAHLDVDRTADIVDAPAADLSPANVDSGMERVDLSSGPADLSPEGGDVSLAPDIALATDVPVDVVGPVDEGLAPANLTVTPASAKLVSWFHGRDWVPESTATFRVHNDSPTSSGVVHTALVGTRFRLSDDTCDGLVLLPQADCTVTVAYAAQETGATASLIITDSTSGVSITAALEGSGIHADCLMVRQFNAVVAKVTLGQVYPGEIGAEVLLEVANSCSWFDVGAVGAGITGPGAGVFRIATNTCTNLLRDSTCLMGVQLAPPADTTPGAQQAMITFWEQGGSIWSVSVDGVVASRDAGAPLNAGAFDGSGSSDYDDGP